MYIFPFDVFSIHNSNLRSLKGNGNTGCLNQLPSSRAHESVDRVMLH